MLMLMKNLQRVLEILNTPDGLCSAEPETLYLDGPRPSQLESLEVIELRKLGCVWSDDNECWVVR